MRTLRKILSISDRFYEWCLRAGASAAGILIVFTMLVMSAHVLMRYFLLMPIKWAVEVTEYLMVWITFLGAAWVLKEEGHIRVDIILNRLSRRGQTLLNAITSAIMAGLCLLITVYGVIVTYESWVRGAARTYLYATPLWLLLICIPIGGFLLFIQAAKMVRLFITLRKKMD